MKKIALIPMLFLPLFLQAQAPTSADTLHVYGPGGPVGPINECAELFSQQTGHPVKVIGDLIQIGLTRLERTPTSFSVGPNTCSTSL